MMVLTSCHITNFFCVCVCIQLKEFWYLKQSIILGRTKFKWKTVFEEELLLNLVGLCQWSMIFSSSLLSLDLGHHLLYN